MLEPIDIVTHGNDPTGQVGRIVVQIATMRVLQDVLQRAGDVGNSGGVDSDGRECSGGRNDGFHCQKGSKLNEDGDFGTGLLTAEVEIRRKRRRAVVARGKQVGLSSAPALYILNFISGRLSPASER